MKSHFYITPEGSYQSANDKPVPDFMDIEIINSGQKSTVQETIKELMESNLKISENRLERRFFLQNHPSKALWYKEDKSKIAMAS
jgi:hypothetical protein